MYTGLDDVHIVGSRTSLETVYASFKRPWRHVYMHMGPLKTVHKVLPRRSRPRRRVQLTGQAVNSQVTPRLTTRCFAHKAAHMLRVQTPEDVRDFTDAFNKLLQQVTEAVVMSRSADGTHQ